MKLISALTVLDAITAFAYASQLAKVPGRPQMDSLHLTVDALGYIENQHQILLDLNWKASLGH